MRSLCKTPSHRFRLLLADDHAILREGVAALLQEDGRFEVVAEADDGRQAILLALDKQPDVVVMDLSMPNTNGSEAINEIKRRLPDVSIVVLTMHNSDEHVRYALRAGADGYVLKDDSGTELLSAVYNVAMGKSYLSPSICHNVVSKYTRGFDEEAQPSSWERLTHREREVVKLVAEGARNRDIAAYLSLSEKTVEKHRSNLMKKLGLHSAAQVATYAISNGIITPR